MHIYLEVASAVLVVIPLAAIAYAYRGTKSRRLALAFAAFAILEARLVGLLVIHTVVSVDHFIEEILDFGGDLAVMTAFALSFLYGIWWSLGGTRAELA